MKTFMIMDGVIVSNKAWRTPSHFDEHVKRTPEEQDDFLSVYSAHKAVRDAENGKTGHA